MFRETCFNFTISDISVQLNHTWSLTYNKRPNGDTNVSHRVSSNRQLEYVDVMLLAKIIVDVQE